MREMKDSGIEWIGSIPKNWDLKKSKYIFQQRSTRGNLISLKLLSPTQKFGVIPQSDYEKLTGNMAVKVNEKMDLSLFRTIHRGDFCISLRSFQGGFEYSNYEGVVSPAYQVFHSEKYIDNNYYKYVFKDKSFIEKINSYTLSLRDGKNISFYDFGNMYMMVPPAQEQQKIANYLDKKCTEIDKIKDDIEKQITILENYKKSIIIETVTKGLNPNVEMKDSGVEWIGKIPKHWQVKRMKYISELNGRIGWQGLTSDEYCEDGAYLITGIDFKDGAIDWKSCFHISIERWKEAKQIQIKNGDLLITKDGTVGKVAIVQDMPDRTSLNSGVLLIRINARCIIKYLFWVLKSNIFWKWFYNINAGNSTIIHLYQNDFYNFSFPMGDMKEQEKITNYLDKKCAEIDSIIESKKRQLSIIEEYKKSLIYEYVTGKREVV